MVNEADLRVYARGFHGRYRDLAVPYARQYAEQLKACGDDDGHAVWHRVADLIESGSDLLDDAA